MKPTMRLGGTPNSAAIACWLRPGDSPTARSTPTCGGVSPNGWIRLA